MYAVNKGNGCDSFSEACELLALGTIAHVPQPASAITGTSDEVLAVTRVSAVPDPFIVTP